MFTNTFHITFAASFALMFIGLGLILGEIIETIRENKALACITIAPIEYAGLEGKVSGNHCVAEAGGYEHWIANYIIGSI